MIFKVEAPVNKWNKRMKKLESVIETKIDEDKGYH